MLTLDKQTGRYSYAIPDCHNKLNECIYDLRQTDDSL
jgi:hypothetical protein